jgi:hypothetical protein
MSAMPSLTILSEDQKFNGDNLLQWKNNITQLLGAKGLMGSVYRSGLLDRKKTGKRPDQTGNLTGPQLRSFRLKMKNRKKTG